jgi:hypothetical protein
MTPSSGESPFWWPGAPSFAALAKGWVFLILRFLLLPPSIPSRTEGELLYHFQTLSQFESPDRWLLFSASLPPKTDPTRSMYLTVLRQKIVRFSVPSASASKTS